MRRGAGLSRRDVLAGCGILLLWAGAAAWRHWYVEPLAMAALCAPGGAAQWPCAPRQALLWAQHWGLLGGAALVLGLAAFLRPRFVLCVAAVAAGLVAAHNFNASFGVLGAALGLWSWVRLPHSS